MNSLRNNSDHTGHKWSNTVHKCKQLLDKLNITVESDDDNNYVLQGRTYSTIDQLYAAVKAIELNRKGTRAGTVNKLISSFGFTGYAKHQAIVLADVFANAPIAHLRIALSNIPKQLNN